MKLSYREASIDVDGVTFYNGIYMTQGATNLTSNDRVIPLAIYRSAW